jgi:hypothetical protein
LEGADSRKSTLRTLVTDMEEGGRRVYGCNVTMRVTDGHALTYPSLTWSVSVYRESKLDFFLSRFCSTPNQVLLMRNMVSKQ